MGNILINRLMPSYQFNEYHECICKDSQENCFDQAQQINMADSFIVKALFWLRGIPTKDLRFLSFLKTMNFTRLDEYYPEEFVVGFGIKRGMRGPVTIEDNDRFIYEKEPWLQKVVWNFNFEKISERKTKISTETRVLCLNKTTKRLFSIYWFLIRSFSGLIRREILRLIRDKAGHVSLNNATFDSCTNYFIKAR